MTKPIGSDAPPPVAAPLLPQEIAHMKACGMNPDDFMALWVPSLPNEEGYSFGATPDGRIIGVRAAGMFTSAALATTRESGLVVVAPSGSALEVLTVGIRMLVKRSGMRLSAVNDHGWAVTVRGGDWGDQGMVALAALPTPYTNLASCTELHTHTLYEAQTIAFKIDAEIERLGLGATLSTSIAPRENADGADGAVGPQDEPDAPIIRDAVSALKF